MTLILSGTNGLSDVDGDASTPAVRGTDANTGIFFPAADTIAFSEGGVERMRIDSSGQLMLGTATSTNTLSVDIQNKSASSNNVFVQIKNTTNNEDVGLIINGLSSSTAYEYQQGMNIVVATPDFCFRAITASTAYRYYFDSTESVRINQYGIGLGANTSPSSGIGITFPATQSASSNANTLDDYEEGTWTPAAEGAVTLGTYTPNNVVATYTKIGGIVVLNADFGFSAASGGVAYLVITGLPFPMKSAGVGNVKLGSVNVDDTTVNISCQRVSAGQDTRMYFASTRDNAAEQAIDSAAFTTSSLVQFQLIYSAV
jgi:hypothetical protein